jgi:glucosamine-6-phosphate deaminase
MKRHFLDRVDIDPANAHSPDGMAADIPAACAEYEQTIAARGGIDLQLLGIGIDGHIGFNEPSSSLGSRTRIKTLTDLTRRANAADFGGDVAKVPRHVITMGVGTIMTARTCLLLAFGLEKADPMAKAVEGPVTAMIPASALQFHPDARVIVDPPAASLLKYAGYYRWVYDQKPDWQRY